MKKLLGIAILIIGSVMSLFGLAYTVWYGLNWDKLVYYTGPYRFNIYLIYVASLIAGVALIWYGKKKLLRRRWW